MSQKRKNKRVRAREIAESRDARRKVARQASNPESSKRPLSRPTEAAKRATSLPVRLYDMAMTYSDGMKDIIGQWSWGQHRDWGSVTWADTLRPFLDDCCHKTWREIESERADRHQKHVSYPKRNTIVKEARTRLRDIGREELEELIFRFRLTGRRRLFGFRIDGVFHVLWWDPEHRICPSRKRRT